MFFLRMITRSFTRQLRRRLLIALTVCLSATVSVSMLGVVFDVGDKLNAELILMRIGTDDEGEYMDIVDDDEELITVGKVFEERLRAMYDIDDSELQ